MWEDAVRSGSLKEKRFKHTVQCNSEHRKAKWGQMHRHTNRLGTFLGRSSYTYYAKKRGRVVHLSPLWVNTAIVVWDRTQYYIVVPMHTDTGDEFGYIITCHPDRKARSVELSGMH